MRVLALAALVTSLLFAPAAEARAGSKRARTTEARAGNKPPRAATRASGARASTTRERPSKRIAVTTSAKPTKAAKPTPRDRSVGAPWQGKLIGPARLKEGEGYHLRRPARTYATRTTIELVRRAILDAKDAYPKTHVLAVGDLSAEAGGWISEHASHQSGRDVDVGLFYKQQPAGYPDAFVKATPKTLDAAATWALVSYLARTADEEGGVQFIFLDQQLQRALYAWAEDHGIRERRIRQVQRVLRHIPNHADHLHVRFQCRGRDSRCR